MTRAEAIATTWAALRAAGQGLVRAAVYLGPLLVAAFGYIAKLCANAVSAGRALRHPASPTEGARRISRVPPTGSGLAGGQLNPMDRLARLAGAEASCRADRGGGARGGVRCAAARPVRSAGVAGSG